MSNSEAVVTRKFMDNFLFVAAHYELEKHGELETAKMSARGDMKNAEISFAAMAAEIRNTSQPGGINDRIRNSIESEKTK